MGNAISQRFEGAVAFDKVITQELEVTDVQGEVMYVANKSGGNFTKGMLVYISGYDATSGYPIVAKADADAPIAADLVLIEDIDNGDTGQAATVAVIGDLNTNAYTVSDIVYLSTTAGGFSTVPTTPDTVIKQKVGVVQVKSATVGEIRFFPGKKIMVYQGVNDAYVKPTNGIPATDLATGVQSNLTAAGTAYQKPGGGIPVSDLVFKGVKGVVVAGSTAGDINVTGIAVGDQLIAVIRFDIEVDTGTTASGNKVSAVTDIKAECTVGAGKITTSSTNTTGDTLLVLFNDLTA